MAPDLLTCGDVVMSLPSTARVEVVEQTGSTNADVLADPSAWPDGSLLVADHQTAGRGRLGRTWDAPPSQALTFTLVLRPQHREGRGWVPVLAGLGVVRALRRLGVQAWSKWPNDVLVVQEGASLDGWGNERKVAGILTQADPAGELLAVGIGVNVAQEPSDLPVPWASSLRTAGCTETRTQVLAAVVDEVWALLDGWRSASGLVAPSVVHDLAATSATVGRSVRVESTARTVVGSAVGLDDDAALLVDGPDGLVRVTAGDVVHLRRR